jgi:poly-gamma-glutamate capsule biosynthesis protein CapA/YwtB (metallophosphatase superfamily)
MSRWRIDRRCFLIRSCRALAASLPIGTLRASAATNPSPQPNGRADAHSQHSESSAAKLFLCGDVMSGRGIDQILPNPSRPQLHEPYMRSALGYVALAEAITGPLARPVDFSYVWGDALAVLEQERPDVRIVNLETSVTTSEDAWPGKGIHYRMHPDNVHCLSAARLDCCTLANNHVMDWGYRGLETTLASVRGAGIRTAGAGTNEVEAAAPAIVDTKGGSRVLIFAFGMASAGVPREWAASSARAGVNFLPDLSPRTSDAVAAQIDTARVAGDIVVASIHWGSNWGYDVTPAQREFARRLIDRARIDVVHGHSSHHPLGIEVYRDRPILYGCGDFLNDYEGIRGHESFRPDLTAAYFPTFDATGRLTRLTLAPLQIRRFRVNHATASDGRWLAQVLSREGRRFGTAVAVETDQRLVVRWR